jgi:hypothetical protein
MIRVPYHYATPAAPLKLVAIGTKNKKKFTLQSSLNFFEKYDLHKKNKIL